MKKTFYIASAFAAILAVGCNKSEQPAGTPETPENESGIVLYAQDINALTNNTPASNTPASKTTTVEDNGKFTVNWADGDQLAVYAVTAGFTAASSDDSKATADWQANYPVRFTTNEGSAEGELRKFVIDETNATKLAKFNENYEAGNLDWYAVYPCTLCNPSHSGKGMVAFGHLVANKTPITAQNGNDDMTHLGKIDALFGKVKDTKEPVISLEHLGALMEFTVTNENEEEFTVQSISFKAPEVIAGNFRLNFTKDEPLDKTDGFELSHSCTLPVENAEPLKKGATAKFYQILAPFTVAVGQSVTITVNTDKGSWAKTMTATGKDLKFEAGKKYNANLNVKTDIIKEVTGVKLGIGNNPSAKYGPYLSLRTGTVYTEGEANCADIDVVYIYVSNSWAPKIAAPGDEWTFSNILTDVTTWSARHKTMFKKTSLTVDEYTAVKDAFELKKIFDESEGTGEYGLGGLTNKDAADCIISAMTESGHYALIHYVKVEGWSNEMNDYVTLNIKMEE